MVPEENKVLLEHIAAFMEAPGDAAAANLSRASSLVTFSPCSPRSPRTLQYLHEFPPPQNAPPTA
ncbi:MAG TPA: hypothetical protein PLY76_13160, partial [Flavobacteriales bacterium]|nr:hypothetical protein [Flavobacteriales bacterium]